MDWTDPQMVQALAVAVVSAITPVIIWAARRWNLPFHYSRKWKKLAVSVVTAFVLAAATTPGSWRERLLAGVVAVLLSQGGYNIVRGARSG